MLCSLVLRTLPSSLPSCRASCRQRVCLLSLPSLTECYRHRVACCSPGMYHHLHYAYRACMPPIFPPCRSCRCFRRLYSSYQLQDARRRGLWLLPLCDFFPSHSHNSSLCDLPQEADNHSWRRGLRTVPLGHVWGCGIVVVVLAWESGSCLRVGGVGCGPRPPAETPACSKCRPRWWPALLLVLSVYRPVGPHLLHVQGRQQWRYSGVFAVLVLHRC